jgi:hypothetical protein
VPCSAPPGTEHLGRAESDLCRIPAAGRVAGPEAAVTELIAWGRLPRGPRPVPASTWLGAAASDAPVLIEHATTLPGSDDVLCWLRIAMA